MVQFFASFQITPEYIQQICSRLLLQGQGSEFIPPTSSVHHGPPPPQSDMPRPSTVNSIHAVLYIIAVNFGKILTLQLHCSSLFVHR